MSRRLAVLVTLPAAAEDAFEEESGGIQFPVMCPDDLEAEVGSETRCVIRNTSSDEEFDVRVTVTSVEDDTAQFEFEFGTRPLG